MNKGNAATTKTKKNEDNLKIESFSVDRAHMFENGGVVLDITLNGIRIYGVKVVEGKNGDFYPSRSEKETTENITRSFMRSFPIRIHEILFSKLKRSLITKLPQFPNIPFRKAAYPLIG